MYSGPHAMYIGKPVSSRMLSAVRRLCGHADTGPTAVRDQSIDRIRPPISPPPRNTSWECMSALTIDLRAAFAQPILPSGGAREMLTARRRPEATGRFRRVHVHVPANEAGAEVLTFERRVRR